MNEKEIIKENMRGAFEERGYNINDCTCNDCPNKKKNICNYAFDLYNTQGNCLASK